MSKPIVVPGQRFGQKLHTTGHHTSIRPGHKNILEPPGCLCQLPIPTAYVDFDATLAINGGPLFNEPRSSRAYGLTHAPQRCLCAAYRNSLRRLRRSNRSNRRQPIKHRSRWGGVRLTLHALSPRVPITVIITAERSEALGQLRSDVACGRQRQRAP